MDIDKQLKMHNMQLSKLIELYSTKRVLLHVNFLKNQPERGGTQK